MKKVLGLLAMFLLLSCDDGDMTFQAFNFNNGSPARCENGLIYKINGNEVLALDIDPSNFPNTIGVRTVAITATGNTVQYLRYATNVSGSAICNPQLSQVPTEVWQASGGTLQVTTTADTDPDDPTIITGYRHTIEIISLTFSRNDETIIIEGGDFGEYVVPVTYDFEFNNSSLVIQTCDENADRLFILRQDEVLVMDLDRDYLFENAVTPEGSPREQAIDNMNNKLVLDIFDGNATEAAVCATDPTEAPLTPVRIGRWRATGGTISVTTTLTAGIYSHTITLNNVTFQNVQNTAETFTRTNYVLPVYSE